MKNLHPERLASLRREFPFLNQIPDLEKIELYRVERGSSGLLREQPHDHVNQVGSVGDYEWGWGEINERMDYYAVSSGEVITLKNDLVRETRENDPDEIRRLRLRGAEDPEEIRTTAFEPAEVVGEQLKQLGLKPEFIVRIMREDGVSKPRITIIKMDKFNYAAYYAQADRQAARYEKWRSQLTASVRKS